MTQHELSESINSALRDNWGQERQKIETSKWTEGMNTASKSKVQEVLPGTPVTYNTQLCSIHKAPVTQFFDGMAHLQTDGTP